MFLALRGTSENWKHGAVSNGGKRRRSGYESFGGKNKMDVKRSWVMLFALFAAATLFPSRLAAQTQTSGDVTGVVSDPSGASVPQARVTLVDRSKGSHQETQTNKDGVYHFFLLEPGDYTVSVNASGFQPATVGS